MRIKLAAMAVLAGIMTLLSCSTSLDEVEERLDKVEARVAALEKLCSEMNSNISSLKGIVQAVQNGDYITSVTPLTENGKEVGYTINFSKGKPITVYHGKDGANGKDGKDGTDGKDGQNGKDGKDGSTPNIGVKQDTDGIWYWTLNGEWLLDGNGQKVKAIGTDGKDSQDGKDGKDGQDGKDGITPQLKIENGYWYVSTDNGQTWSQLGKATGEDGKDGKDGTNGTNGQDGKDGDSMFKSLTVTDTEVIFVTSDNQTFVIKRAAALSIEFDSADLVVMGTNATREIHYTITSGVDDITIEALSSADIKVKVNRADAKTGSLQVKTGATIDEYSKVVVLVNNGSQAIMRTLTFEEEAIKVEEDTTKGVTDEGGEVTLEFFSNVPCQVVIPEEAQSWISIAPETKAMEKQTIGLIVKPNEGLPRSVTVKVVGNDDTSNIVLSYTIAQEAGGVWKEGTVPPDNEIWYETSNKETLYDLNGDCFDQNVIANSYSNGKGVIKLSGPLKVVKSGAFFNSWNLKHLLLPDCVEELEDNIFPYANIEFESFYIPKNLSVFTGKSFCPGVIRRFEGDDRVINNGLIVIVKDHIRVVAAPKTDCIFIPGDYEVIDDFAMWGSHPELKHITIEDGVTTIGSYAFSGCKELETVHLPQTMSNPSYSLFDYCDKISSFSGPDKYVSSDGKTLYRYIPYYASDGITLSYVKWVMNVAKFGLTNYVVEDDIYGLDPESFCRAEDLQSISFPRNDIQILGDTFDECYNLEYISGPGATDDHRAYIATICGVRIFELFAGKGIKAYTVSDCDWIQGYAFAYWPELKEVIINEGVIQNGSDAFWGCPNLEKVVFPSTYESIGSTSFANTKNVREIWLKPLTPPIIKDYGSGNTIGLEDYKSQLSIYVPEPALSAYEKDSYWGQYKRCFKTFETDDYYVSSDYTSNGTTTTLQQSSTGNGVDLVIMGDAFSDRQIADGTYAHVMQKAADAFFSEEPYKSMKDRFNVYTVNVVSATEGYEHSGQALSTGHGDGTSVYGNDSKVIEYAKKAISEDRLDDAVIIVMMNEDAYAGTCFMYNPPSGNYGRGLSIAYFPTSSDTDTFNGLVSHEAGGHGFAKLADEYAYEYMGAIASDAIANTKVNEAYGWWKNVDFTSDPELVKWSQFLSDPRYASEGLGCFEGGLTYWTGVWRPTDASIMRYNTGGFNAPSRYAIWYRIGKLAYGESWEGTYEDFVAYDAINRTPAVVARRDAQRRRAVQKPLPQLPPPVVVGNSWREELQKGK